VLHESESTDVSFYDRTMVPEAPLEQTGAGLVAAAEGCGLPDWAG
jgi:hypothetical protein